ncbi:hypothetical protein DUNSADRAFT_18300 [Dunaliella salina]|uniref:Encoded protein n=1 Tax=Dunaliella salina TaxID=3046 RepID=A0ABQ7G0A7_DUNSA|nr:hypothetical protein DUNSADRAFT_18300 [Dunaliella salina]|eukprot:KAF5828038.1 hypothetical protein DUNSADRAFT_18300 [Dunaliella salina]
MIRQLDSFLTGPSVLFLYSNKPLADRRQLLMQSGLEFSLEEGGLQPLSLTHLRLRYNEPWLVGEAALKSQIQVLYPLEFKAILILAQDSPLSIADADSRTIATLMNLRQVQVEDLRTGRRPPEDHPLRNPTHHPRETPPSASRRTSNQGLPLPDLETWSLRSGCPGGLPSHYQQAGACVNGSHEVERLLQAETGAAESEKGL